MKFTIQGKLPSLNDYVLANRSYKYAGASMKKRVEKQIQESIFKAISSGEIKKVDKYPVGLNITWYEPTMRRDIDNICFAVKFIQDALVATGVLENDSQRYISELNHTVLLDRENPRITVEIIERKSNDRNLERY